MYDQILFVEGPSDEQILREFAKTLNVNLGQLNVGFIQMRGVRNLGHYAAAEIVSFLTNRRVKLYFMVDTDESQGFHFRKLREEFGGNAHIHVLKKREIENYLLSASANISHLIARKRITHENFAPPSPASFLSLVGEAAQALKPLAIWKRVLASASRPLYPKHQAANCPTGAEEMKERAKVMLEIVRSDADELIAGIDRLCDEAESAVEGRWAKEKLDIVPGSAILDEVYRSFGFRYDKMRDGIGVASQMNRDEIDSELKDFIKLLTELSR